MASPALIFRSSCPSLMASTASAGINGLFTGAATGASTRAAGVSSVLMGGAIWSSLTAADPLLMS